MIDLVKGKYWHISWSPVTGCAACGFGKGCPKCWGGTLVRTRLAGHPAYKGLSSPDTPTGWNGEVRCHESRLKLPNGKSKVIALNWMGELFNPKVPFSFIDKVFALMMLRRQHTFLLLTKNPGRLKKYMQQLDPIPEAVEHIWFGTSASTQREWAGNTAKLLEVPAVSHRWVSLEPMLEKVDILSPCLNIMQMCAAVRDGLFIDWIAMGAQSGVGARPMELSWAEKVIEQGQMIGIPIFYKQGPDEHGARFVKAPSVFGGPRLEIPFDTHQAA